MPLMGFSDPKHIPLILDGSKAQTTRKPRKNPIKVGDVLQVYYKPRMRQSCNNCINYHIITGKVCPVIISDSHYCPKHINFVGTAKVIKIVSFHELTNFNSNDLSEYAAVLYQWARADGFKDFQEADEWFTRVHGSNWMFKDWDIIYFDGDWHKVGY